MRRWCGGERPFQGLVGLVVGRRVRWRRWKGLTEGQVIGGLVEAALVREVVREQLEFGAVAERAGRTVFAGFEVDVAGFEQYVVHATDGPAIAMALAGVCEDVLCVEAALLYCWYAAGLVVVALDQVGPHLGEAAGTALEELAGGWEEQAACVKCQTSALHGLLSCCRINGLRFV